MESGRLRSKSVDQSRWRRASAALRCGALAIGVALSAAVAAGSDSVNRGEARDEADAPGIPTNGELRLREGTELVDSKGRFRMAGDRLAFFSDDGKTRLVCVENLNLERIARTILEHSDALSWNVSGVVTEYRGSNYLLVRRAVLNSRLAGDDRLP